jgi:hypothetical protein
MTPGGLLDLDRRVFQIRIGGSGSVVTRDLPVREVRPGLHLAILTLAGDQSLPRLRVSRSPPGCHRRSRRS